MSCDNSDYSYAHKITGKLLIDDMTELLEEPVEEQQPTEQVGVIFEERNKNRKCSFDKWSKYWTENRVINRGNKNAKKHLAN